MVVTRNHLPTDIYSYILLHPLVTISYTKMVTFFFNILNKVVCLSCEMKVIKFCSQMKVIKF